MSKPKRKPSAPPSLNAIYRQQLLLRDSVERLEGLIKTHGITLTDHCQRLLREKEILQHMAEPLRPVPTLRDAVDPNVAIAPLDLS